MPTDHQKQTEELIHLTVAVFYQLRQAEKAFQDRQLKRRLVGRNAAVVL
jgi:hypothetical protein